MSGALKINMKKAIAAALCVLLLFGALTGCGKTNTSDTSGGDRIRVVTTIFPEYDWVRQIVGDDAGRVELTLLLDSGVDLHSYQPTVDDIIKVSSCDMFIYVGGESDKWVKDVLKEAVNKDMVVISLLDVLGDLVKEEEAVEGMQEEHGHEHEDEEEGPEYDEHVWLSVKNAERLCRYISSKLCELDAAGKDRYTANTDAYAKKLSALDKKYEETVGAADTKTLVFGDRFPFRYLADDYGLDYYAAFAGCSAESEASFETIAFLAGKVDELGLKAIMQIEGSDGKIARTIKETTASKDQAILTLDSMQSAAASDIHGGTTYLSIMEKNLEVLKDALKQLK